MKLLFVIAVLLASLLQQGCSVSKAANGPTAKDLSVLNKGTHRDRVLLEFGSPVSSELDSNGNRTDLFKFIQGQSGGARAGKSFVYGVLAVGTLGLSELATTPLEGATSGAEMQIKIIYDANNTVNEVVMLKDDRWIPIQKINGETKQKKTTEVE